MDKQKALEIFKGIEGRSIEGWTIVEFINNGKSAAVFRGVSDRGSAAVKVFDKEILEKFGEDALDARNERERSLIGQEHPHLIKMLGAGCDEEADIYYLIMEFIEGKCLQDCLDEIPFDRISDIITQIASAAEFLESLGLAHRDIKPANIVISNDFSHATLLDLGVLRPIGESELTDHGSSVLFVGTNQYASPEFALRKEQDTIEGWRAVTFYQLGAVLHDLIIRAPIFAEHLGVPARLAHAVQSEIVRIRSTSVPPWLATLAQNCLVKRPETRLRLVSWDSFKPRAPKQDQLLALQEAIRQRAAAATTIHDEQRLYAGSDEPDSESLLLTASNLLQEILRNFGRIDPPLGRRIVYQEGDAKEIVRGDFEPSTRIGLPRGLSIRLRPDVLDAQSKVIKIVGLGSTQGDRAASEVPIYEGGLDEDRIEEQVVIFVLSRVDEAQVAALAESKGS